MAKVWFARRVGARWEAVDRRPAYEMPLSQLIFKLDLGWQRRLDTSSKPVPGGIPESGIAVKPTKVLVEVSAADLEAALFPGYQVGWYDSPFSPAEVARRLGSSQSASQHAG